MHFRILALSTVILFTYQRSFSQGGTGTVVGSPDELLGQQNAITTAVPFLSVSPDARHAALGDAGVATSPDANSSYWNAGKLVFIDKKYGGSLSYTPWLGKIVNDMSVSYLTGFYKLNREQAVSASIKYFDLGDISFRDLNNNPLGDFNPREFAFDATYSRLLTENFSVGITGRYIYSNLTGAFAGIDAKPGNSVAVDIGAYYTTTFKSSVKESSLSLGGTITNIGAKLSYTDNQNKDFLPTTIRLGSVYKVELDGYNSLSFILDFSKLMVPTPPIRATDGSVIYGRDDKRALLSGMFGSFSDAPNGFKEEIQEIMTSAGIEYWYNDLFAARFGYFNESKNKGNRKYMTIGLGFRRKKLGIDVAYLVPVNKRESPLAETLRFSLLFQVPYKDTEKEESVTTE